MAVKPILFSTEMVRAILEGRKTMTRRVVKLRPREDAHESDDGETIHAVLTKGGSVFERKIKPRYQPGDILWVRETWMPCASIDSFLTGTNLYEYKADFQTPDTRSIWRPSIFMPKEAARIFLRVNAVRAERVQEITDEDAKEEGANFNNGRNVGFEEKMRRGAVDRFHELWDSINAKRGFGWDRNPWVCVIGFERIEKPEGWPC